MIKMDKTGMTEKKTLEDHRKKCNIYELAQKGVLDEIQKQLGRVTNLAFVTVDYQGKTVTESFGCTEFCKCRRTYSCYSRNCCLSNAFGSATAAISNQPYSYRCPSGLVNFALPIVIDKQYMGAMIGGQVRCNDAEDLDDFGKRFQDRTDWKKDSEMYRKYNQIPIMPFRQIQDIAELAFLYVRQFCEKESAFLAEKEWERKTVRLSAEVTQLREKEKQMDDLLMVQKKEPMNVEFMLNILNAVSSLAFIEDAHQTGEMVECLTKMTEYQMKPNEVPVALMEELDHVECYLKIQKLRFEDKMSYEIVRGKGLENQVILPKTLLPFVENAVSHGILARRGKGKIRLFCYMEQGDCMITVEDEGAGVIAQQLNPVYESYAGCQEDSRVEKDIRITRQRLMKQYGPQYDIKLAANGESGTRIILRIPQMTERIRYYV